MNKYCSLISRMSVLWSGKNSLFYIFSAEGILESALDILPTFSGLNIAHYNLLDIQPEFCLPRGSLHAPAMEFFFILLATLLSQPVFNLGERVVI